MKFSHILKFNTVPEWRDHYIHYAVLKKIIYNIAKAETEGAQHGDDEYAQLPSHDKVEATEDQLIQQLNKELYSIISFYLSKEAEVLGKLERLDLELLSREHGMLGQAQSMLPRDDSSFMEGMSTAASSSLFGRVSQPDASAELSSEANDVVPPLQRRMSLDIRQPTTQRAALWHSASHRLPSSRVPSSFSFRPTASQADVKLVDKMKHKVSDLFVQLHDLKNFLEYNKEGFRKILKKHDKLTSSNLKDRYWVIIEEKYPSKKAEQLDQAIAKLVEQYAVMCQDGNMEAASEELNSKLRDQIKVERNTVWKDMVAMERKTVKAAVVTKEGVKEVAPSWVVKNEKSLLCTFAAVVFAVLLTVEIFPEPEKQNCLALLVFLSILWVTEAIPLYATSMMVPPLVVILRVLVDHTHDVPVRMPADQAAPTIFHAMFSQTIMLLLGGFAIAGALSKHFIAKQLAIAVLARAGRNPRNVLLASMFVATFASMWISNVAAPVLTFSIVMPILKSFGTTNPFAKSMVMGIALASNIGGMTSPISSPQNIFAIERMSMDGEPPSWLTWFAVALPVSCACNILCWLLILAVYQPGKVVKDVKPLKPNTDPMNRTQAFVIFISLLTVALWCSTSALHEYIGEMGVVATLPLVAFFGFGVLDKDDFNGFLWNVVMLAMGGMALGEAVKSSGLLLSIAQGITAFTDGLNMYQVLLVFCALVMVMTTIISHTVGAMVILPIVQKVGEEMPDGHPKLLVMATALMCSGAMGLPVSGFPNMNARQLEDSTGQTFVDTSDFLKVGIPGTVAAYLVIVTIGYGLMVLVKY